MSLDSRVYYTTPLVSGKSVGTIRYVGSIPPTAGEWLGIEWDDPTRGKHDGVHEKTGVRYFECRNKSSSTCASFVRPNAKGIECGQSFAQALKAKYLDGLDDDTAPTPNSGLPDHSANAGAGPSQYYDTLSNFKVEVVDLSKIKKTKLEDLKRLKQVGLEWEGVNGTGLEQGSSAREHAEVMRTLQVLEKLDLSYSLLSTLQSVAEIVQGLTRLRHLALNANCFAPLVAPMDLPAFCNLKQLDLNATMMSWAEILHLSLSLPNLEELQLGDNDLVRLASTSAVSAPTEAAPVLLPQLKILNLTRNRLESWDDILASIRGIPAIESLVLSYNALPNLNSLHPSPPSLKHLNISHNSLASLTHLPPTLISLELSQNPCFAQAQVDESTLRMVMIAVYAGLERFERTGVSKAERRDAEIRWIERMEKGEEGLMRGLVPEDEVSWVEKRVEELRKIHHLEAPTPASGPTRLDPKSRLLNLNLFLPPSLNLSTNVPTQTLSILPTLRTLLLRTQISKLIGKPLPKTTYRFVALLRTREGDELVVPIPTGEEGRLVGWWGLQDGDAIRVEEVLMC